jgi:hypothetical protein
MTYCSKCGTKLDEEAKFCPVCGTVAGAPTHSIPPPYRTIPRKRWSPVHTLAIVLAIVLLFAAIGGILYLPFRSVNFNQLEQVPFETGINAANLDLSADVATYNITFGNLGGNIMIMNVSAIGGVGLLAPSQPLNVTTTYSRSGNTLFINSKVDQNGTWWPIPGGLKVTCDVQIDRALNLTLRVSTNVGNIILTTSSRVVFDSLDLNTVTGQVEASLGNNVIINNAVMVQSTTGTTNFSWESVRVTRNITINVRTTTGATNINITQNNPMLGNVTLNAETVTGSMNFDVTIHNNVGATISSTTTTGGINTDTKGFSGTKSPLQSTNYPAASNFIVTLQTTTGPININAVYSTGPTSVA